MSWYPGRDRARSYTTVSWSHPTEIRSTGSSWSRRWATTGPPTWSRRRRRCWPTATAASPPARAGCPVTWSGRSSASASWSAMLRAASELGYRSTNVQDVIERAGVSRPTFYEHFANKDDCFLAAFDTCAGRLRDQIATAADQGGEVWRDRLRIGFGALLAFAAAEPEAARMVIVEARAATPDAALRRVALLDDFATCIDDQSPRAPSRRHHPLRGHRLRRRRRRRIPPLRPPQQEPDGRPARPPPLAHVLRRPPLRRPPRRQRGARPEVHLSRHYALDGDNLDRPRGRDPPVTALGWPCRRSAASTE